jgi:ElaB/YqjD/DUF883 family membrane-anchored ribosome-binding protein
MITTETDFELALMEEDLSMLDDMEAMIANVQENGGRVAREVDEFLIRKMIIKTKFLEKEQDRLKSLRDAVKAEWDRKINKIDDQVKQIKGVVQHYLEEHDGKLQLDVATASLRTNKHKIIVQSEIDLLAHFEEQGTLENFLGERPFNANLAKQSIMDGLDQEITRIKDGAKEYVKAEEEKMKESVKDLKPAEKKLVKENFAQWKKDVLKQADEQVTTTIQQFKETLPEFLQYEPESKGLSIRLNF